MTNVAALFRLIADHPDAHDRRVVTPKGSGILWQCFAGRAAVILDADQKRVQFFKPGEVAPERARS